MSKIHHTPLGHKSESPSVHKDHHNWDSARWVEGPSEPCLCPRHRPETDPRLLRMMEEIEERELLEAGCPTDRMIAELREEHDRAARQWWDLMTPEEQDAHIDALEAQSLEWGI